MCCLLCGSSQASLAKDDSFLLGSMQYFMHPLTALFNYTFSHIVLHLTLYISLSSPDLNCVQYLAYWPSNHVFWYLTELILIYY